MAENYTHDHNFIPLILTVSSSPIPLSPYPHRVPLCLPQNLAELEVVLLIVLLDTGELPVVAQKKLQHLQRPPSINDLEGNK